MRFLLCMRTAAASLLLLLVTETTTAFVTPTTIAVPISQRRDGCIITSTTTPPSRPATRGSSSLSAAVPHQVARTTLAGKIWPALARFYITPAKAKLIVANVLEITNPSDIAVLCVLAFCVNPLARLYHDRWLPEDVEYQKKRFGVANIISKIGRVALSVYAFDALCVALATLGFKFVDKWGSLANAYAKIIYTVVAVREVLILKKRALCSFLKVPADEMGRVDVINKISTGFIVAVVSLLLFDWLSVRMGVAMKGVFAFGSVGTLAFTLASQGVIRQFISGLLLIFSDKMYVGDNVTFGDGTAGRVTKLGFMETILRNSDNTVTRVPNALLAEQKISNVSRVRQSQVKQTLRFHYEDADKLPQVIDDIKEEIKKSCSRMITDGTRPFRVFWTNYNEDHLEVMVDTHHNLAPIGNAYWENRQQVLMAIDRGVRKSNVKLARLYSVPTADGETEWRVVEQGIPPAPAATSADAADAGRPQLPSSGNDHMLSDPKQS